MDPPSLSPTCPPLLSARLLSILEKSNALWPPLSTDELCLTATEEEKLAIVRSARSLMRT